VRLGVVCAVGSASGSEPVVGAGLLVARFLVIAGDARRPHRQPRPPRARLWTV